MIYYRGIYKYINNIIKYYYKRKYILLKLELYNKKII
jgi:hypothetical protein